MRIAKGHPLVMKAYELNATVTADGHIELPDFQLSFPSERPKTVKIIILVAEPDEKSNEIANLDENSSEDSFKRSWQQAINGETVPLSEFWEDAVVV
jgi:hypothetical protein